MSIAILGWGSLLWDLDDLAPKVDGNWQMGAGPRLPMEFSRISSKRKMGLVVCLDPENGAPCPTHAIQSIRADIIETVADLAARERCTQGQIGYATPGQARSRLPSVAASVQDWLSETGWSGAVWTDLDPNFAAERGEAFSVARGMAYLRTLRGESWAEAHRYIAQAPAQTDTPLRRALAREDWWRAPSGGDI